MDKTTLYLPRELHGAIKAISRRTGRSQATIIRDALQRYVDGEETPQLASLGLVDDAGLHGADVEDWLKANWHPDAAWGRDPPPTNDAAPHPE
jgi:predicted transcriptional regulator